MNQVLFVLYIAYDRNVEKKLNTIESVFIVSHHADELGIPVDSEIKVIKNADGISQIQ